MIEFLNNLFSPGNQQIPVALQNPDPENPNSPYYKQNVYERQIAPWMRAGIQSPQSQLRFESAEKPAVPVSPEVQQAKQQQEMLKRYAMTNMGRAGGRSATIPGAMGAPGQAPQAMPFGQEAQTMPMPGYTPSRLNTQIKHLLTSRCYLLLKPRLRQRLVLAMVSLPKSALMRWIATSANH